MKKTSFLILAFFCCFLIFLVASNTTLSKEGSGVPPKPDMITISSFGVEGSVYPLIATIGEAVTNKFGIKIRQIPCPTDISRAALLNSGKTDFTTIAAGAFFASEGLYEFAEMAWGPQPLSFAYVCIAATPISLGTFADKGIKTFSDIRGKRVPYFLGSPGLNAMVKASLAWGGLTYEDVQVVEYGSLDAGYAGVIEDTCDVTVISGTGASGYKMAANPRGLYYIPMPPEDKEGWERFQEHAPYYYPALMTTGAGLSEDNPTWLAAFGFPVLYCRADLDENKAYWLTKAIWETYDIYSQASPVFEAFNLPESGLKAEWLYPWHPGSEKYLKEVGLWTELQELNQMPLMERQRELSKLWEEVLNEAMDKSIHERDFPEYWEQRRSEKFPNWYQPIIPEN